MPNKGVLTVAYKRDVQLDEGYYLTRHAEIIERVLVPLGLERTEVRKIPPPADSPAPPYQFIWSGYFPSVQALQEVLQTRPAGRSWVTFRTTTRAHPTSSSERSSGKRISPPGGAHHQNCRSPGRFTRRRTRPMCAEGSRTIRVDRLACGRGPRYGVGVR